MDADDDLPIVDNLITNNTLNATIIDITTKGNPEPIEKWQKFVDFVKDQEKLHPPFGVKVKNHEGPMVSLIADTPEMVNLNKFIVFNDLQLEESSGTNGQQACIQKSQVTCTNHDKF
jgi:hypothetical protein